MTLLAREEVDEACNHALAAMVALGPAPYATGSERLTAFRRRANTWKDHPGVKGVGERLALG